MNAPGFSMPHRPHPTEPRRRLRTLLGVLFVATSLSACGPGDDATAEGLSSAEGAALTTREVGTFSGKLSVSGKHWAAHAFTISAPGRIDVQLDWGTASSNLNVFLYDASGALLTYSGSTTARPEKLSFDAKAAGTYKVGISCKSGSTSYKATVKLTPAFEEIVFSGTTSASGQSWLTHSFAAAAGDRLDATLDWADVTANLNLFLYDPSGALVAYTSSTTARPEKVSHVAALSGTWKVALKCKTGSTAYALTVRSAASGTTPAPTDPTAPFAGKPKAGTLFWGAAINGNGDPVTRHELPSGEVLALRRTFFQWSARTGYMIDVAKDDLAHGRLPWVSIKPPSWADMAAGKHDAEIDQMLLALKALPGPVWLTIHHEPEGGGGINAPDDPAGPAGHRAMNKRVRQRMTAMGADNVALAPILMTWTWTSQSGRNPNDWWEPGIYDFLGVDHYRDAEATLVDATWLSVRTWAAARGVDVAVGEWGMRGTDAAAGNRVREWYDHAARSNQDGKGARVVGLAAFDSNLNSPNGGWELMGGQLDAFRALMGDPRTAHVP